MFAEILMGIIGFGAGIVVATGLVAFIISLGIVPRYAGITHTGNHLLLYEMVVILGTVLGNVIQIYNISIPVGGIGLAIYGLFSGIFLGSWAIALAEIIDAFPIMRRRLGITKGIVGIILAIAVGKLVGAWWFFASHFSV